MSLRVMLSTSFAASRNTLPKLAADGSNWIVWKTRIQILITAKNLAHILDDSDTPPAKPKPPADDATVAELAEYDAASEKFREFHQSDAKVKHFIVSTIHDSLIKTASQTTASGLWKAVCAEYEKKARNFAAGKYRNLQNQRCLETDDIEQHLTKLLELREELAATGTDIDEGEFISTITNTLPPSYDNVISAAYAVAIVVDKGITTDTIIAAAQMEHSHRKFSLGDTNRTSAALFSDPQKSSSKRNNWKKKQDRCTNQECRFRHTHDFKNF